MALVQTRPLATDRMLTEQQVEAFVGWRPGVAAVKRARRHSMPPHYKLGRAIRYRESDVIAWLESQRVESLTTA